MAVAKISASFPHGMDAPAHNYSTTLIYNDYHYKVPPDAQGGL